MSAPEQSDPEFDALIRFIQETRGVDFRGYKKTSLRRRILRRMEDLGCEDIAGYYAFLEAHPQEFVALLNTVLINVTSFFRDKEAWDVIRDVAIPRILERKTEREPIRVWSVGCASGEEPYSLAILFAEALGMAEFARRVKIYATDLDEEALAVARHAIYTPKDVEGVPPDLLETYFDRTNNHYVVHRDLRKAVIFGRHNIVHDAPISRIDLLVCRNLLIYLETDTQNLVLPRMHYALVNDGIMFLGKAETQLARSKMFEPLDLKHRIFRKVPQEWRRTLGGSVGPAGEMNNNKSTLQTRLLESIVDCSASAYLAVDADGNLIFANAMARRLLDVAEPDLGRPFQDLAISYRPAELRSRIDEATRTGRTVRLEHQEYARPPAEPQRLTIDVTPLLGRDGRPFATLLGFTDSTRVYRLGLELQEARESLETTVEELQSANEELETTNEELQSTNEELETTNEELQSTNEELETINEELRSTNEELEVANEELRRHSEDSAEYRRYADSVLRGIDAGIIVLDDKLTVQSWNRWCETVWGLRTDEVVGQPLDDLDMGLPVQLLRQPLEAAMRGRRDADDIVMEGMDRRGRAIMTSIRISPLIYEGKTPHGVVLIIQDVTEAARTEEVTRYLGRVIGKSLNEVYFLDPESLKFTMVNKGAEVKLGYSLAQLRQLSLPDLLPGISRESFKARLRPLLAKEQDELVVEALMEARDGSRHPVQFCLQYFADEHPPILVAMVQPTAQRMQLDQDTAAA